MLFDDTFEHDVHNQTDGRRVVLFLDVVRPMPWPLSLVNRALIHLRGWSPGVRSALRNYRQWETTFDREIGWQEL